MSDRATSIIELFGVVCLTAGVAWFSIPVALIVLGVISITLGMVG